MNVVSYAVFEEQSGLLAARGFVPCSKLAEEKIKVLQGKTYQVFLLVNMGNRVNDFPSTLEQMEEMSCRLPQFSQMDSDGIPMAGSARYTGSQTVLPVGLRRLLARLTVVIDHSAMGENGMRNEEIRLQNVAQVLYPFDPLGSKALSPADLYSGETDSYSFPLSESYATHSSTATLYVPENVQGSLREPVASQDLKIPEGKEALCTYLEFSAHKDGQEDGVDGPLKYRVYLGENELDNFSVYGNRHYHASLTLSWNGLFLEGDWRVTREDGWADTRQLGFLDENGAPVPSITLYKGRSSQVFTYYTNGSDGGAGICGAKELAGYPYGWQLWHRGEALCGQSFALDAGVSALFTDYVQAGGRQCGKLTLTASADATSGQAYQLRMATLDGQVQSVPLTVTVQDIPVCGQWNSYAPTLVAQKGILRAVDAVSGEPQTGYRFVTEDSDKIRLSGVRSDGSVTVSSLKPGDVTIQILDAGGMEMDRVSLRVFILPLQVPSQVNLFLDGDNPIPLLFPGHTLAPALSEEATGPYLDRSLLQELLFPIVVVSDNYLLEGESVMEDDSVVIYTHFRTFEGLPALSGDRFLADRFHVLFPAYEPMAPKSGDAYAYNPFRHITQVASLTPCLNDYSLYKRPSAVKGWLWNDAPAETAAYTLPIAPFVMASAAQHLVLSTQFDNGAGEVGAVATGVPSEVAPDAGSSIPTWTLQLSMKGVQPTCNSAGPFSVYAQIHNASDGSVLSQKIASGYIRLHLYLWGQAERLNAATLRLHPVLSQRPTYPDIEERVFPHISAAPVGSRFNSRQNLNEWLDVMSHTSVNGAKALCRLGSLSGTLPQDVAGFKRLLSSIPVPLCFESQQSRYWYATNAQTLYFDPSENVELYMYPNDQKGLFVLHICDSPAQDNEGWLWN